MMGQNLACAAQRGPDDLAEIVRCRIGHNGAGFELGHVEQVGDEAIEPLRFVDDGREQLGLFRLAMPSLPQLADAVGLRRADYVR